MVQHRGFCNSIVPGIWQRRPQHSAGPGYGQHRSCAGEIVPVGKYGDPPDSNPIRVLQHPEPHQLRSSDEFHRFRGIWNHNLGPTRASDPARRTPGFLDLRSATREHYSQQPPICCWYASRSHRPMMVILSATAGKILASLPLAGGSDGAVFNPTTMEAFSTHGNGTLTIVKEKSPTNFDVQQNLQTMNGARTVTFDSKTGHLFTMSQERGPAPPPPPGGGRGAPGHTGTRFVYDTDDRQVKAVPLVSRIG